MRKSHSPISLDIQFQDQLDRESCALLTVELIKNLLLQRNQIPMQYEFLKKDVEMPEKEQNGFVDEDVSARDLCKLRRTALKSARLKHRFREKTSDFIRDFESLSSNLYDLIRTQHFLLESVLLMFGSSPVTPKEIFEIVLPEDLGDTTEKGVKSKRFMTQLFRSLVMSDELASHTHKRLQLTNVYVAVKWKGSTSPDWTTSRPELTPTGRRGQLITLTLKNSPDRLKTPFKDVSCTPVPMVMCTPFTIKKSAARPLRHRHPSEGMTVTPCVRPTRPFDDFLCSRNPSEGMTETPCVRPLRRMCQEEVSPFVPKKRNVRFCQEEVSSVEESPVQVSPASLNWIDEEMEEMHIEEEEDCGFLIAKVSLKGFRDTRMQ